MITFVGKVLEKIENYMSLGSDVKVILQGPILQNFKGGPLTVHNILVERPATTISSQQDEKVATAYKIHIKKAEVQLSAKHFHAGKGFIERLHVVGLTGMIDRLGFEERPIWRIASEPGDFELSSVSVADVKLRINYPSPFHSYDFVIFQGKAQTVRKQYLILDLLSATSIIGTLDHALFSLLAPKTGDSRLNDRLREATRLLKIEDLDFHHLVSSSPHSNTSSHDAGGPLSLVETAKVDLNILLCLPRSPELHFKNSISVSDLLQLWPLMSAKAKALIGLNENELSMDIHFKLKNVKTIASPSAAPSPTMTTVSMNDSPQQQYSLVSNLLLRQVLAYINTHQPSLPIKTFMSFPMDPHFLGIQTLYDTQIPQLAGLALYDTFLQMLADERRHLKNIKKVALWSFMNSLGLPSPPSNQHVGELFISPHHT
jgi:mitochondrial distribution and morphology protein 31